MIPNVPTTSNFWILLLLSGILLTYLGFRERLEVIEYREKRLDQLVELRFKQIDNKKFLGRVYTLDRKIARIDSLGIDTEKKYLEYMSLLQQKQNNLDSFEINSSLLNEREDYHNYISDQQEKLLESNLTGSFVLIIPGFIILIFSISQISRIQGYRDRILEVEYLTADVKKENCQSCGMKLSYDLDFDQKSNYCSHCFQDGAFLENSNLEEMKEKVKEQLVNKGFSQKEIKTHINGMKNLDRWKKKLDWK